MRFLAGLVTLALAFAAGAQAAGPRGTLTGVVTRGPIAPVCVAELPCDAPAKGVTLVFSRDGAAVARAVTNDEGAYRLRLRPGRYDVRRASAATVDRKLQPTHVRVVAGRVIRVDFSIDTGIR